MEIAVLGGGNGSYAAAADLSENGHNIRLWRRKLSDLQPILNRGSLLLKDYKGEREITISLCTDNLADALLGAELILIPTPAFAQEDIAKAIAPHLKDGQVVYLPPGSFGSYIMAKTVWDSGNKADVAFAESGTLPYLARKHGEDNVTITTRATRLPSGVFPARLSDHAFEVIAKAFPSVEKLEDGLSGALMNAGPIIHPPLIMMNAGPIEHFEHWDIHNEGTQPAIRRVTTALDNERIAIREALGYGAPHFPLADHYDPEGEEWMYGNAGHERLVDSGDWREDLELTSHRYMLEDIAVGLAFLVSVGNWAGIPCPVAEGLLSIASAVVDKPLRQTGRTLESLDLSNLSKQEMSALMNKGFA